MPVSMCVRELRKLECSVSYGGQSNRRGGGRDRGNLLLKLS